MPLNEPADQPVGAAPEGVRARVVLFSRPGCHLCDAARRVVEKVSSDLGEPYEECDITLDPQHLSRYVDSIPVVEVDGVQVDFWRVSEDRLRAALRR
jgi:glutaredoxin